MLHPEINPTDGGVVTISAGNTSITAMEGGKVLVRQRDREIVIYLDFAVAFLLEVIDGYEKGQNVISATTAWEQHAVDEVIV